MLHSVKSEIFSIKLWRKLTKFYPMTIISSYHKIEIQFFRNHISCPRILKLIRRNKWFNPPAKMLILNISIDNDRSLNLSYSGKIYSSFHKTLQFTNIGKVLWNGWYVICEPITYSLIKWYLFSRRHYDEAVRRHITYKDLFTTSITSYYITVGALSQW